MKKIEESEKVDVSVESAGLLSNPQHVPNLPYPRGVILLCSFGSMVVQKNDKLLEMLCKMVCVCSFFQKRGSIVFIQFSKGSMTQNV